MKKFMKIGTAMFCLSFALGNLYASSSEAVQESCIFVEAQKYNIPDLFFDFARMAQDETETFESLHSIFKWMMPHCCYFQFKYPLKDEQQAKDFVKVLKIKAQQAHRFVPVISSCEFIAPSHLGFTRKIIVKEKDYLLQERDVRIQEHIVINADSNAILFIEEWIALSTGEIMAGHFAAINDVIEEEGQWYFTGTYLYDFVKDVEQSKQMFDATYRNMVTFLENEDVEVVYQSLAKY
jgi:hypothetical protein